MKLVLADIMAGFAPGRASRGASKNLLSLLSIQAANYLFPLITIPYLARVLGLEAYGRVAIATTIVGLMTLIVDWGFSLGATSEASRQRGDHQALANLFWTTTFAKGALAIVPLLGMGAFVIAAPVPDMVPLVSAGAFSILASVVSTDWLLQGMERMGTMAIGGAMARALAVPLTFALVHTRRDAWISIALNGGAAVFGAVVTIIVLAKLVPLLAGRTNIAQILGAVAEQRHFFVSRVSIYIYTASTPLILSFVLLPASIGLYAGADKISRAVLMGVNQISVATFPRLSFLISERPERAPRAMALLILGQGALTLVAAFATFLAAPIFVRVLLGPDFSAAAPVLRWLALLPVVIGLNNAIGVQALIGFRMQRTFSAITAISAVVYLILVAYGAHLFGAVGAAGGVFITEVAVLGAVTVAIWRGQPVFFNAVLLALRTPLGKALA